MRFRSIMLSLAVAACLQIGVAASDAAVFLPAADSTIRGGSNAGSHFGSLTNVALKIDDTNDDNKRTGYLKFDLSSVASTITDATITMTSAFSRTQGVHTFQFWGLTDSANLDGWGEMTIEPSNAPAITIASAVAMNTSLLTDPGSQAYDFDTVIPVGDTFTFSSAALASFLNARSNDDLVTTIITAPVPVRATATRLPHSDQRNLRLMGQG